MNQIEAFRETLGICEERWPRPMFGVTSIEHMRDMLRRIEANSDSTAPNGYSEAKLGRCLGYLQGVAVGLGVMCLDEYEDINKRWAGDASEKAPEPSRAAKGAAVLFAATQAEASGLAEWLPDALSAARAAGVIEGMKRTAEIVAERASTAARIANQHHNGPLGPLWTAKTGALASAGTEIRAEAERLKKAATKAKPAVQHEEDFANG